MPKLPGAERCQEFRTEERQEVVVVLSYESIEDMVNRGFARPPDRLVCSLSADPSVQLLIVGSFRSWPVSITKRLLGRGGSSLPAIDSNFAQPHRLARRDPSSVRAIERHYRRFDRIAHRAAKKAGMTNPAVIVFHPVAAGFTSFSWARSVTFYARDDWAASPAYSRWHDAYLESYRRIRQLKRRVVAVSEVLLDRLEPTAPSLVVSNGVDESEWHSPEPPPDWFDRLPSPRLVYVGTLDGRLDLDAIKRLATRHKEGSIALVGPTPDGSPVEQLQLPNVHIIEPQDRKGVVGLIHAADLCLLTHHHSELTTAMSPLKLYEYLAGGRPVLAAHLDPLEGIDDRVVFYHDLDELGEAADRALAIGPMAESERVAFIADNTWSSRHREVMALALESNTGCDNIEPGGY